MTPTEELLRLCDEIEDDIESGFGADDNDVMIVVRELRSRIERERKAEDA